VRTFFGSLCEIIYGVSSSTQFLYIDLFIIIPIAITSASTMKGLLTFLT
jgi:hypothetical protein